MEYILGSILGIIGPGLLPSLFAPPLSPPTNYQTEGSGARLTCMHMHSSRRRTRNAQRTDKNLGGATVTPTCPWQLMRPSLRTPPSYPSQFFF